MKKSLLFAAAACLAGTAMAAGPFKPANPERSSHKERVAKQIVEGSTAKDAVRKTADTRATQQVVFGYCEGFADGIGTGTEGLTVLGAIGMTEAKAKAYEGNTLKAVEIAFGPTTNPDFTLFLTYSLEEEPFYTQQCTFPNQPNDGNFNGYEAWNEIALTTPYIIEGKAFYIGYQTTQLIKPDYPLGVDDIQTSAPEACWIGVLFQGSISWTQYGEDFGSLCINAIIEGDSLPQYDLGILDTQVSNFVKINTPFNAYLAIRNDGLDKITEVTATAKINGKEVSGIGVEWPEGDDGVAPGEFSILTISGLVGSDEGVNIPVEITLDTINGTEDASPGDNTVTLPVSFLEYGFARNIVVEEWTGTWCGWCPRGIEAMKYMEETYGNEGFIGIAIHGGDPMETSSYDAFMERYSQGSYPGSIMQRMYLMDPNEEYLNYYYNTMINDPAYGQIGLTADYSPENPNVITVDGVAEFALDLPQTRYRMAFVVTENNVGPYIQENFFSPLAPQNKGEVLAGWSDKGPSVSTRFNHVARIIKSVFGINNSIPADIVKGEKYNYSTTVSISNVKNLDNCEVVALLLDYNQDIIVNAAKFKMTDAASVDGIAPESRLAIYGGNGEIIIKGEYRDCKVFNIDGTLVANGAGNETISVPGGIYIVNAIAADGTATSRKLIVK